MREINRAVGAGAIMSTGLAAGAVSGAMVGGEVTGLIIRAVRLAKQAGDEGWDVDGNYVCSKFVFNFETMEVFDGSETHSIDAIVKAEWADNVVNLYFANGVRPKSIAVGNSQRSSMIYHLISEMWEGHGYTPDKKDLLSTYTTRVRVPGLGTLARYAVRSVLLGIVLYLVSKCLFDNYGSFHWWEYRFTGASVFAASLAWRLFRPVTAPKWSSKPT